MCERVIGLARDVGNEGLGQMWWELNEFLFEDARRFVIPAILLNASQESLGISKGCEVGLAVRVVRSRSSVGAVSPFLRAG